MFFFLFKQKTAYEMRISDWSSDVCSSDLAGIWFINRPANALAARPGEVVQYLSIEEDRSHSSARLLKPIPGRTQYSISRSICAPASCSTATAAAAARSEEHTSELQSLMRISYAVFCLKKKKTNIHKTTTEHTS